MSNDTVFFKNIYYNSRSNKIHLWWNVNGVNRYDKYDYTHEYYSLATPHEIVDNSVEKKTDMYGNAMVKRTANKPSDVKSGNRKLAESDLKPEVKFLHKKFDKMELKPDINKVQIMYYDIEVAIQDEFPDPEEALYPINAIAQYFTLENKLYVYGDKPFKYVDEDGNKGSISQLKERLYKETGVKVDSIEFIVCDELTMLEKFIDKMHQHKTDIFTGWNTEGFDNLYIINRLKTLNSTKDFSPVKQTYVKISPTKNYMSFGGITSIDYLQLYRDKYTFDNKTWYSLDNIARIETGKSKLEYDGSIKEFYQNEWDKFMLYNMIDTLLVKAIDNKKGFMNLALISANNNRIKLNDVLSTISGHVGNVIELLHDKNMVLNDRPTDKHNDESYPGGISWNNPGFYKYCVSFDIASMYPHLIVRDNLGPETLELHLDDSKLKDVVRIDDHERKRSFFFWPDHKIQVGREVDGKLQVMYVLAKDVTEDDMVVLYPDEPGWQGAPKWKYNMGKEISWFPKDK